MVSSDKLPASREELLDKSKEFNVQIPTKTKEEMAAGAAQLAGSWSEQCVDSGLLMLRKRYTTSQFLFEAELIKVGWRNWDVLLRIYEPAINKKYKPKLLVELREEADKFISEEMLAKIVMVCG